MQLNVSRTGSKESMLGGNAEKVTNGNYDMQVNYPWWRQFTNEWNHIHTFIMILFLFPYICIPILFSLSGKSNNNVSFKFSYIINEILFLLNIIRVIIQFKLLIHLLQIV